VKQAKMSFSYPRDLCFECIRCGLCCGDTNDRTRHVLLLPKEADSISVFAGLPVEEFTLPVKGKSPYVFEMKKKRGKCVFLRIGKCAVYRVRPLLCRFYPFSLRADKNGRFRFLVTAECPGLKTGKILDKLFFACLFEEACSRFGEDLAG
jgi:Fe-S-cluster containining protein